MQAGVGFPLALTPRLEREATEVAEAFLGSENDRNTPCTDQEAASLQKSPLYHPGQLKKEKWLPRVCRHEKTKNSSRPSMGKVNKKIQVPRRGREVPEESWVARRGKSLPIGRCGPQPALSWQEMLPLAEPA